MHEKEWEENVTVMWEEEQEWMEQEKRKRESDRRERNEVRYIHGMRQ
jgi:hypothetical protein